MFGNGGRVGRGKWSINARMSEVPHEGTVGKSGVSGWGTEVGTLRKVLGEAVFVTPRTDGRSSILPGVHTFCSDGLHTLSSNLNI